MILYFSAEWCGPCKVFKPIVKEASAELGVAINYVDVDVQKDLAMKYDIRSVPTIVVDNNGSVVYRNSGVMAKAQLMGVLSQFK